MNNRRKRRVYSNEFKKQIVKLYKSGKSRKELILEYDLTPSAFDKWVAQYKELDTEVPVKLTECNLEQSEQIKRLKREIETLHAENTILKQTVIIFGRMIDKEVE